MQVGEHRCRVGVPEYTPPELQGRSLGDTPRTKEHDAFGLAVLLFQLLFLGRHPYSGVTRREMPLAQAIGTRRFVWSRIFDTGGTPPPNSLLLSDVPVHVRLAFERAFGRDPHARPDASAWKITLEELEHLLLPCARDPHHHRLLDMSCPWCRLERRSGGAIFGKAKPLPSSRTVHGDELMDNAEHVLRKARKSLTKQLEPAGRNGWGSPSDAVQTFVREHALEHARLKRNLPEGGVVSQDRFTLAYLRSRDELEATLSAWRQRIGVWDVEALAAKMEQRTGELKHFEQLLVDGRMSASANARAAFVTAALRAERLAGAAVSGLSRRTLQELAKKFDAAIDIDKKAVVRASGLGSARQAALLLWRDEVENRAMRAARSRYPAGQSARDCVRDNARVRVAGCRERLEDDIQSLKLLHKKITNEVLLFDAPVSTARKAVAARQADLLYLGLPLPR